MRKTKLAVQAFEYAKLIAETTTTEDRTNKAIREIAYGLVAVAGALSDIYDKLEEVDRRVDSDASFSGGSHRRPSM